MKLPRNHISSLRPTYRWPLAKILPFSPFPLSPRVSKRISPPYTNFTNIRFRVMEGDHKPLLKDSKAEISSEELSQWFQQDSVRSGLSLHRLEAVLGLAGLCTLLGTSMRIGVANDQMELDLRRRL